MNLTDFDFDLPEEFIAQTPLANRAQSKLLVLNNNKKAETFFFNILNYLGKNDILVLNDTRVIKARLFGKKSSGGGFEIFINKIINKYKAEVLIKRAKNVKLGEKIYLKDNFFLIPQKKNDEFFLVDFSDAVHKIIRKIGSIPLPHYIKRKVDSIDEHNYQTIFSKHDGAVAAPTAGLHFDSNLFNKIKNAGVKIAYITLHVGYGTFKPVREIEIKNHKMHSEIFEITSENAKLINNAKEQNGKIIAIGTTTLRALESSFVNGKVSACKGETSLFIYPGFQFKLLIDW